MSKADAALDFYRRNLGLGESPPGSNHNWLTDWFGIGNVAWCAITASRALNEAFGDPTRWRVPGVGSTYAKGSAYVWSFRDYFAAAGRFDRVPRVGSLVLYNWNGAGARRDGNSHVGIVETVVGDGTIVALEGNYHDSIARVRRSMQFVEGFCHPPYEAAPSPGPTPPKEEPEVALISHIVHPGEDVAIALPLLGTTTYVSQATVNLDSDGADCEVRIGSHRPDGSPDSRQVHKGVLRGRAWTQVRDKDSFLWVNNPLSSTKTIGVLVEAK